jgi:hypothetical protein
MFKLNKMNFFDCFVIFIMGFFVMFYVKEQYTEVEYVKSDIDNKEYLVKVNENSKEVADKLALMNQKFLKIIEIAQDEFPNDPRVEFLKKNYDPSQLSESTKDEKYTSYSINKEKILFCLIARDENGALIDDNTLTYVGVHELAHLATDEIGHTDTYWDNFKWLLTIARENGLYLYEDYSINPKPYCGIKISSNILDS